MASNSSWLKTLMSVPLGSYLQFISYWQIALQEHRSGGDERVVRPSPADGEYCQFCG